MTRRLFLIALCGLLAGCEMPPDGAPCGPNSPCCPNNQKPQAQMVAFTASWCGPCKQQAPLVSQIEAAGVYVTRIDIDLRPDLARQYGVTAVPTYFYYEGAQLALRTHQAGEVLQLIRRPR